MTLQQEGRKFFASYIEAWNDQDVKRMSTYFAEPCVFVLESGTTVNPDRTALQGFLSRIFEDLNGRGFDHSTFGDVSAQACNETLAVMDVSNVARYHKDGSVMEVIDAHFTLRLVGGSWEIVTAVWCRPGWRTAGA